MFTEILLHITRDNHIILRPIGSGRWVSPIRYDSCKINKSKYYTQIRNKSNFIRILPLFKIKK